MKKKINRKETFNDRALAIFHIPSTIVFRSLQPERKKQDNFNGKKRFMIKQLPFSRFCLVQLSNVMLFDH